MKYFQVPGAPFMQFHRMSGYSRESVNHLVKGTASAVPNRRDEEERLQPLRSAVIISYY